MIAFPSMLKKAAEEAGMQIPDDPEMYEIYSKLYPHLYIFCQVQLGAPMPYPSVHFDNAKIIATIPEDQVETITYEDITKLGIKIGYSKNPNWFVKTFNKFMGVQYE